MKTGSWGGEGACGEVAVARQPAEQVVSHSCMVDKIRRDTFGISDPSFRPDCAAQDSLARKMKPHNFSL